MARSRRFTVRLKRVRTGKTNYKSRLKTLSSKKIRLVIRKKLNILIAQFIKYEVKGDRVITSATTKDLRKFGWNCHLNNIPASYLLGYLVGIKSQEHNIKEAILDIGLHPSVNGSSIFAVLKGVIDSGLKIPVNEEILPSEERVSGKHIQGYCSKIKGTDNYNRQFSGYLKNKVNPDEITKNFEEVKKKIGAK